MSRRETQVLFVDWCQVSISQFIYRSPWILILKSDNHIDKRWGFYYYQFIYVMTTDNFLKDDTPWYELRLSLLSFSSFRYCLRYLLFYLLLWCFIYDRNSTYVLSDRDVSVRMSSPIMIFMTWGIEWWDKIGSDT